MFLPVVTNFYSGMPAGDEERLKAAAFAADIGFAWVLAHEAAHYRNGHFHILKDHPDWFGITPLSVSDHLRMADGAGKPSAIGFPELARQIEWDADRAADRRMVPGVRGNALMSGCVRMTARPHSLTMLGEVPLITGDYAVSDAERLTERVEALERKVAKLRRASIFVGCVAISFGGPMIYLERGLATAVVLARVLRVCRFPSL